MAFRVADGGGRRLGGAVRIRVIPPLFEGRRASEPTSAVQLVPLTRPSRIDSRRIPAMRLRRWPQPSRALAHLYGFDAAKLIPRALVRPCGYRGTVARGGPVVGRSAILSKLKKGSD